MSDLRERIADYIRESIPRDTSATTMAASILALPEIAEALAGRDAVRRAALEEAALVAEAYARPAEIASRIRAMKAAPAPAADAAAVRKAAVTDEMVERAARAMNHHSVALRPLSVQLRAALEAALADAPGADDA